MSKTIERLGRILRRREAASAACAAPLAKDFMRNRRGGAAVWFTLTLPVVLMFVGAAVDYNNESTYQRQLQAAVDSAALAAAVAQQNSQDPTATANQYMANNFSAPSGSPVTTTVSVDATTSAVTVASTGAVPTYVMGLAGYASLPLDATATASTGASGPTEVSIVFDTTYSMTALSSNGVTKLANAQSDAVALINKLFVLPNGNTNPNVKAALVPFGVYVNLANAAQQSMAAQGAPSPAGWNQLTTATTSYPDNGVFATGALNPLPWLTNTNSNTTYANVCNENHGPYVCVNTNWVTQTCYNDTIPYDCSYQGQSCNSQDLGTKTCGQQWWSYSWNGCVATTPNGGDMTDTVTSSNPVWGVLNYTCASPMQRLTTDYHSLISQINSLQAYDDTYIAEGLVWGWRALSPNAPFADGAPYNSGTKKILILMTDGFNTNEPDPNLEYPWDSWAHYGPGQYANDWANDGTADANTKQVCQNIVNSGITVYTIAFQVNNSNVQTILKNCATTPENYYDATDIVSLSGAFQSIGASLTQAHLTQ